MFDEPMTSGAIILGHDMRNLFGGLLASVACSVLCLSVASAGEPRGRAAAHDWSGFYAGGNIGYAWGSAKNTFDLAQPIFAGGDATMTGSDSDRLSGIIAGGQIGYNWQIRKYVFGIEADLQASGQTANGAFAGGVGTPWLIGTDATSVTHTEKLKWLSTARGRFGVTEGPWLLYATGGLAIGKINSSGEFTFAASAAGANAPGTWDQSSTKVGWVLGAGGENALTGNWSWKVEYLYVNLGEVTGTAALAAGNCYGPPTACNGTSGPGTGTVATKFSDQIVRLGLNYKFGN